MIQPYPDDLFELQPQVKASTEGRIKKVDTTLKCALTLPECRDLRQKCTMTPAQMAKLYEQGRGLQELARLAGTYVKRVRAILVAHGCTIRKKGPPEGSPRAHAKLKGRTRAQLEEALRAGQHSFSALGRQFGLSNQRVQAIAVEIGVSAPTRISEQTKESRRVLMRDLRKKLGMKRSEFASLVGLDLQALDNRDRGRANWRANEVERATEYLRHITVEQEG